MPPQDLHQSSMDFLETKLNDITMNVKKDYYKNSVLILVSRGSRRHAIARKLNEEFQKESIQTTLFTYKRSEITNHTDYNPIEIDITKVVNQIKNSLREQTKVIVVMSSTLESAHLFDIIKDDDRLKPALVFLPRYFEKHVEKKYHKELATLDFAHLKGMEKAKGLSSEIKDYKIEALRKLDPGSIHFKDILKELPKELLKDVAGAAGGGILKYGMENYLLPMFGQLIGELGSRPFNDPVPTLAQRLSRLLKDNADKFGFEKGYITTEGGMIRFIDQITKKAKNPFLGSMSTLLVAIDGACDHINDERCEAVVDEIASRWALDMDGFRNLINNLHRLMKDKIITDQELESRLNSFREQIAELEKNYKQLRADYSRLASLQGIIERPADLGILLGESPKLRIERDFDLVRSGNFEKIVEEIHKALNNNTSVLIRGPKGIGKSVLAKYALAEMLNDRIKRDNKFVVLQLRSNLEPALIDSINSLLNSELRANSSAHVHILYFDPFLPVHYADPSIGLTLNQEMLIATQNFENVTSLCSWQKGKIAALVVISDDVWETLDEKLRLAMKKAFAEIIDVDLSQIDFLKGVIKAHFKNDRIEPRDIEEQLRYMATEIGLMKGGYSLVAAYAGRWLSENEFKLEDLDNALRRMKEKPVSFFKQYIEKSLLANDPSRARSFVLPLLVHVSLGTMPPELARILPTSLGELPLSKELSTWIAEEHEDLLEQSMTEIVISGLNGKVNDDSRILTEAILISNIVEKIKSRLRMNDESGTLIDSLNFYELLTIYLGDFTADAINRLRGQLDKEQFGSLLYCYSLAIMKMSLDIRDLNTQKSIMDSQGTRISDYIYYGDDIPDSIRWILIGLPIRNIDGLPWKITHEPSNIVACQQRVENLFDLFLTSGHLDLKCATEFVTLASALVIEYERNQEDHDKKKARRYLSKCARCASSILATFPQLTQNFFGLFQKMVAILGPTDASAVILFQLSRGIPDNEDWLLPWLSKRLNEFEKGFINSEVSMLIASNAWTEICLNDVSTDSFEKAMQFIDRIGSKNRLYHDLAISRNFPILVTIAGNSDVSFLLTKAEKALTSVCEADPEMFRDYLTLTYNEKRIDHGFRILTGFLRAGLIESKLRFLIQMDFKNAEHVQELAKQAAKERYMLGDETMFFIDRNTSDRFAIISAESIKEPLRVLLKNWQDLRGFASNHFSRSALSARIAEALIAEAFFSHETIYQDMFAKDWEEYSELLDPNQYGFSSLVFGILTLINPKYRREFERALAIQSVMIEKEFNLIFSNGSPKPSELWPAEIKSVLESVVARNCRTYEKRAIFEKKGISPILLVVHSHTTVAFAIEAFICGHKELARELARELADHFLIREFDDTYHELFSQLSRAAEDSSDPDTFRIATIRLFYYIL